MHSANNWFRNTSYIEAVLTISTIYIRTNQRIAVIHLKITESKLNPWFFKYLTRNKIF